MKKKETASPIKKPKNIFYRIVMAVSAVLVPIVAYFNDLLYIIWDSELFKLLAKLEGNKNDNGQTLQNISIRSLIDLIQQNTNNGAEASMEKLLNTIAPIRAELIAVGVCLVLCILFALAVFFVSCFSRNQIAGTAVAGGGLLSGIALFISFHYLSIPLLAGKVSLGSFLENPLFAGAASLVMQIHAIKLSTAAYLILFLFIFMIVWGVANILIELGEKTPKSKADKAK